MNVPVRPVVVVRLPCQVVWRGLRTTCAGADEAMDSAASKAMTSKRTYDTVARPNMLLLSASMTNLLPCRGLSSSSRNGGSNAPGAVPGRAKAELGNACGKLGAHGLADVLPGRCQPVAGARDSRCLSYLVGLRHAPTP